MLTTIDAHAAGEPLRIVTSGVPPLRGETLREKRAALRRGHDDIRRILLWEPRGHSDMYGAVVLEATTPEADLGVIFMTNEGYSTMCGHGIIALTTALIETGRIPTTGPELALTYETPAGLVRARASIDRERVVAVRFRNVPAFRLAKDLEIDLDGQMVAVDVAFGGAWYAIARSEDLGLEVRPDQVPALVAAGMAIKRAVNETLAVAHPTDPELAGMYGTVITAPPVGDGADGRNVTIYAEGAVARSPCGTGTSARLACLHADGNIRVAEPFVHESIVDTVFTGQVVAETTVGELPAVTTDISGEGFLTGMHTFVVDRDDPLGEGFFPLP
jgi:proline racemase